MKKEEFIRIRMAGWQKKYISLQAEKAHKSLSQYVRRGHGQGCDSHRRRG